MSKLNWKFFEATEPIECSTCTKKITKGYRVIIRKKVKGITTTEITRCKICWNKRQGQVKIYPGNIHHRDTENTEK